MAEEKLKLDSWPADNDDAFITRIAYGLGAGKRNISIYLLNVLRVYDQCCRRTFNFVKNIV